MRSFDLARMLSSEKGVALPITIMILILLASLTAAFATLSLTEPQITANLVIGSQALDLADAGIQDALWGFNNPVASGLSTFPTVTPSRYNASWIALGAGGYVISLTNAPPNEVTVQATGSVPTQAAPRAKRTLIATLTTLTTRMNSLPAALTVNGQIGVSGNTTVDGRQSVCGGGAKLGVYSQLATTISAGASVYGQDTNLLVANEPTDYAQNQAASSFTPWFFTQQELNLLKALAKANGSYYQGTVTFGTGTANPVPTGITFVDTVSGNPIGSPPTATDLANVTIDRTDVPSSGWLIIMGTLTINGHTQYTGLIYAANDLIANGSGSTTSNSITGAVVTQNVLDTVSTSVTTSTIGGNNNLTYDCNAVKTGVATGGTGSPTVPQGYFVKPGTWREG